ncbi:hypothetical protein HanXRQr2_Chr06g0258821 [Helianthus annuus]|uniref:Uncharacterized protein n=1 Tax=Helianthus annuus TaxID=4232 RepID=A0A251UKY5_HELAN|nr:hypothetical protein HanXRQr2_Chr06g0258821 [Helianthus annuus]KAJ0915438.1 hypothetical protein HanPSC8_Chr06g0249851 [Helianthus annuus]
MNPVGFATPSQFLSTSAYHECILRQIRLLKARYHNELLKMHYHVRVLRIRVQLNHTIFHTIYQHIIPSFIKV